MKVSNISYFTIYAYTVSSFSTSILVVKMSHYEVLFLYVLDQRPWSEWKRTDASCIQHTGHDVEQVQELYSMCEEPLLNSCSHRKKLHWDNNNTSYLSPMN